MNCKLLLHQKKIKLFYFQLKLLPNLPSVFALILFWMSNHILLNTICGCISFIFCPRQKKNRTILFISFIYLSAWFCSLWRLLRFNFRNTFYRSVHKSMYEMNEKLYKINNMVNNQNKPNRSFIIIKPHLSINKRHT